MKCGRGVVMTDYRDTAKQTPVVEVVVWRDGEVVHRQFCDSEGEAASVAAEWTEVANAEAWVDDLTIRHGDTDILAAEPPAADLSETYAHEG